MMVERPRRAKRSGLRRLWWLWIIALLSAGGAFSLRVFLRPENLRGLVIEALEASLVGEVEVGSCTFSLAGGIDVRDVSLRSAHDGRELLQLSRLRVWPRYVAFLSGRLEPREVICESPVLSIHRAADGRWSFEDIVRREPKTEGDERMPFAPFPLRITHGEIRYRDEATFAQVVDESLKDAQVELRPAESGLRLRGDFELDGVRRLTVEGTLDRLPDLGWVGEIELQATRLDLARRAASLRALLPPRFAERIESARPSGVVNVEATWRLGASPGHLPDHAALTIVGCHLTMRELPWTLDDLRGRLDYKDGRLELSGLAGLLDGAPFRAEASVDFAADHTRFESWNGILRLEEVRLDDRCRRLLPESWRTRFDDYRPSGVVEVEARVVGSPRFPPDWDEVIIRADLRGVGFALPGTSFRPTDVRGAIKIEKGVLSFERPLEGRERGTRFSIAGGGIALEPGGAVDVTCKAFGLPLDEDVRALIPVKGQRIWDFFSLVGTADVTMTLTRDGGQAAAAGPEEPIRIVAEALPRAARIRWVNFPYEVTDIGGAFSFDSSTMRLAFFDLKGRHGEQVVTGEGVVEFGKPVVLKIMLHSPSLQVDDDLKAALDPRGRALLEDFGFEGHLRTDVSIHSTARGGVEVVTELEIMEASVRPKQFPYLIELRGGRMKLTGQDAIELVGVRTAAGVAPFIEFNGDLLTQGTERWLSFNFDIEDLPFDEELRAALPEDLARFTENFGLGGVYRGKIEGDYRFDAADPENYNVIYRARDLRSDDAEVDFGIKIKNMSAVGNFLGRKESGKPGYFEGNVTVASARFNRLHLTNGEIEFAYGIEHSLLKSLRAGLGNPVTDYVPPRFITERLKGRKSVENAFQMVVHSPDMYGGIVDGFLFVDTGERQDLGGEIVGHDLQMAEAALDVFGVRGDETSGSASGTVWFSGRTGDAASLIGEGSGVIAEARLLELPLFLGILSLIFGENSSRHYFNDVAMAFKLRNGKFRAASDGIDIRSQALKLRGGGTMDFEGNLDLTLEPRLFGFEIPIVEQVFSLLKKGIAQVWITGNLEKPNVQFVTGAGAVRIGLDVAEEEEERAELPSDLRERAEKEESGSRKVEQ